MAKYSGDEDRIKIIKFGVPLLISIALISIAVLIKCQELKGLINRESLWGEICFWLCYTNDYLLFAINGVVLMVYTIYRIARMISVK